ncbi:hypothetical protein LEMLEM_LOCUS3294 [Lemmus lemmus]
MSLFQITGLLGGGILGLIISAIVLLSKSVVGTGNGHRETGPDNYSYEDPKTYGSHSKKN